MTQNPWKSLSIFMLGLITGFMLHNINFSAAGNPFLFTNQTETRSIGNKSAQVTIVEYSDFQCPFCKKFYEESFIQLKKEYVDTGKVYFTFKDYPLKNHPQAEIAAEVAHCAAEQNKFWEMHDEMFAHQDDWSLQANHLTIFRNYAEKIGLDMKHYDDCLQTGRMQERVNKEYSEGIAAGVSGTPTLFINGKIIVGAIDYRDLKMEVEQALQK